MCRNDHRTTLLIGEAGVPLKTRPPSAGLAAEDDDVVLGAIITCDVDDGWTMKLMKMKLKKMQLKWCCPIMFVLNTR